MKYTLAVSHDTRQAIIGALKAKRTEFQGLLQPGQLKGIEHQREMVKTVEVELGDLLQGLESDCAPEIYGCDLLLTFHNRPLRCADGTDIA